MLYQVNRSDLITQNFRSEIIGSVAYVCITLEQLYAMYLLFTIYFYLLVIKSALLNLNAVSVLLLGDFLLNLPHTFRYTSDWAQASKCKKR